MINNHSCEYIHKNREETHTHTNRRSDSEQSVHATESIQWICLAHTWCIIIIIEASCCRCRHDCCCYCYCCCLCCFDFTLLCKYIPLVTIHKCNAMDLIECIFLFMCITRTHTRWHIQHMLSYVSIFAMCERCGC